MKLKKEDFKINWKVRKIVNKVNNSNFVVGFDDTQKKNIFCCFFNWEWNVHTSNTIFIIDMCCLRLN